MVKVGFLLPVLVASFLTITARPVNLHSAPEVPAALQLRTQIWKNPRVLDFTSLIMSHVS